MSDDPRVLVVHSGARHNYAIPSAFAGAGMLEAFYTDMCAGKGVGRVAAGALPGGLGALGQRLANRLPPEPVLAKTRTDDIETVRYEMNVRRMDDPSERRRALAAHNRRRGETMARWGTGNATHLYNVLGEGGALCGLARDKGLTVFSDIIIALSTSAIHDAEFERFPDWGPAPPSIDGPRSNDHLLATTDVFVCPSAFVADDLVANWGVTREATRIVPYALSSSWYGLESRPEPGRVLFVGSADRRKGIHYLAMAADRLSQGGEAYTFRVAGDAHPTVRAHKAAKALDFLGRVSRDAVRAEFAAADVFVLPTLAEGSATVIYEAMAAGLAVITTHAAGSVIRDGVDGLVIPERDPVALAGAIETVIGDRALRNRLGSAAKARAQAFGWDAYADALVGLVQETPGARSVAC
ncbi:MAG: glycosyltransferase family 4 protein [Pseudomonadota bacterium]